MIITYTSLIGEIPVQSREVKHGETGAFYVGLLDGTGGMG